ncbi:capsid [uncultured virus]|uniref:Capsid n=1 Tax=uncultured virus TaxID=340016 RepID=A0A2K9LSS5_9VIRU|nr:capsid [uncultured virus]
MAMKSSRRKRSFKKRGISKKQRVKKIIKPTRVLNESRFMDATASGTFALGGALSASAGYMSHTTSAVLAAVNYGAIGASFRLSDLPNYTEFTNLYESYKINRITVRITPMATGAAAGAAFSSTVTQTAILFHWCLDYDDSSVPTASDAGVQALRQRSGYKFRNIYANDGKPIVISWVPRVAASYYNSAVSTAYGQKASPWLDEGSDSCPHYGLKMITETVSTGAAVLHFFKVDTKLSLSFKGRQ